MNDKAPKKPATLRVYPVSIVAADGTKTTRYIEAPSPAHALTFAFKPELGEPLTVQEVMQLIRAGGASAIESVKVTP
jgi:hypothetical protein